MWLTLCVCAACVADDPERAPLVHEGWVEDEQGDEAVAVSKDTSCAQRYVPPAQTQLAASHQDVAYERAGARCSAGATFGAMALGDFVQRHFGRLINTSVPGSGVQIYNCRRVNGGSSMSLHAEGRALDLFIPTSGEANNAKGDTIANYLVENAEHIGVQMIIWDRTIWQANRDPQWRCYTGRHSHNDHIHVELTRAAAQGATPFFRALNSGREPSPDSAPDPWVGAPCRSDSDCDFLDGDARGHCFLEHGPANERGMCTLSCQGYCPDRGGYVSTFCASTSDLGATSQAGTCLSRAAPQNDACQAVSMDSLLTQRFVGRSGAARAQAQVCVTPGTTETPDPEPEAEPDPEPDPEPEPEREPEPEPEAEPEFRGNGGICEDPELPVSDHGEPCSDVPDGHWRCACSGRFEVAISQVCRSDRWVTYHTEPADCSRCQGEYSRACD